MKNYLFAPFKNDDEKIESFNRLKMYLPKAHKKDLIMFMGSLESYYDCIMTHLKEEKDGLRVRCDELKAELSQLKADCIHDAKVCDDYDDDLIKECHELQAENDRLKATNESLNDALKTSGIAYSSHYPKEYNQEADEYFEHNPKEEKLFFFMVGGSGVDEDGDVIDTLNVGVDAIAECDNFKGVISVETYD